MAKQKKKIRKRKRLFNLQTKEGQQLALNNKKLFDAFPDKTERTNYLKALIEELDRLINLSPAV
jgi:hypothetical protein